MTKTKNISDKIAKMDFETALARLEEVVETLSSQKVDLNSMVDLYEEGNALREHCSRKLEEARMKIEVLSKNTN